MSSYAASVLRRSRPPVRMMLAESTRALIRQRLKSQEASEHVEAVMSRIVHDVESLAATVGDPDLQQQMVALLVNSIAGKPIATPKLMQVAQALDAMIQRARSEERHLSASGSPKSLTLSAVHLDAQGRALREEGEHFMTMSYDEQGRLRVRMKLAHRPGRIETFGGWTLDDDEARGLAVLLEQKMVDFRASAFDFGEFLRGLRTRSVGV